LNDNFHDFCFLNDDFKWGLMPHYDYKSTVLFLEVFIQKSYKKIIFLFIFDVIYVNNQVFIKKNNLQND